MKHLSFDIRFAVDGLKQIGIYLQGNIICKVIIVAEERRLVKNGLSQKFVTVEVIGDRVEYAIHIEGLFVEDMCFYGGEAIGGGAKTRALDVVAVVTRTTIIIIPALADTVLDHH